MEQDVKQAGDGSVLSPQSSVLVAREGAVLSITINRPEARNAMNGEVLAGLIQAFRQAADPGVAVVTLTGAGDKAFCAGADLKAALAGGQGAFEPHAYRELLLAIHNCPKPTVALARGHVLGGGVGLLLACDLALACDDIQITTPEIQVGMFPMMVLGLLSRHLPPKRAAQMVFLGEPVAAPVAVEWGLINGAYARAEFDAAAAAFLGKVASRSTAILRLGKEALTAVEDAALPDALERLQAALAHVMATEDSKEGMRAFLEKRQPAWTGR